MWTYQFEAQTHLKPELLWPVLADIARWPEIDQNIESIEIESTDIGEAIASGTHFRLKPKGGPQLQLKISEFEPPFRYADLCKLPLGEMKTVHQFLPTDAGSTIRVTIEIPGPLGWLWGALIGRNHAKGLQRQTERFIARAGAIAAEGERYSESE